MKDFAIHPHQGVGDLKLGMTRASVHALIGEPIRQKKSRFSDEITDYWNENGLQLAFSGEQGVLVEISLYSNLKSVTYGELEIFSTPPGRAHQLLCKEDGDPRITVGVTVLLNLGVAMTGFQNDDQGDDSITVFAPGRWSGDDPDLKPLQLSK